MRIIGIENLTPDEFARQLRAGGRFVQFEYCVSIIFLTFRRRSDIYFVPPGKRPFTPALTATAISLLVGWWAFPWGPIFTIWSVVTNLCGGRNVTRDVVETLNADLQPHSLPLASHTGRSRRVGCGQ